MIRAAALATIGAAAGAFLGGIATGVILWIEPRPRPSGRRRQAEARVVLAALRLREDYGPVEPSPEEVFLTQISFGPEHHELVTALVVAVDRLLGRVRATEDFPEVMASAIFEQGLRAPTIEAAMRHRLAADPLDATDPDGP